MSTGHGAKRAVLLCVLRIGAPCSVNHTLASFTCEFFGLVSRNTFNFVLMKTGKQAKASAWPTDIKSL